MKIAESINIRLLTLDDVEDWLKQCAILDSESGEDGIYFGPYNRGVPFSIDKIRKKTIKLWSCDFSEPGWRRAWGIFDDGKIVGSAQIAAGDLPTNLHRVHLGLGIYSQYRNLGLGQRLFDTIIHWCRNESTISWIDLGVFSGNDYAKIVFEKVGFKEIGYIKDAWFIDGHSIGETLMTLNVE